MKRRICCFITALCLLFSMFPFMVSADDSGLCGDNLHWIIDNNGNLSISGSGAMWNFEKTEDEPWFRYRTNIKNVIIGEGVTSIGSYAFFSCENITRITIPSTITRIGYYAFGYCVSLTTVSYSKQAEQWAAISVADGNQNLWSATIQYGPSVQLTSQRLTVNGEEKATEIYNIDGSNYFKLRDVAMLLNGTGSQFSVGYDTASGRINIIKGAMYASVGGELVTGTDKSSTCVPSSSALLVDGLATNLTAYNIGGNNFFKLRDLADSIGFIVNYNASNNTIVVTAGPMAALLVSGVCGDGVGWSLHDDGCMVIAGNGKMYDYSTRNTIPPWSDYLDKIETIVVTTGVTSIGNFAFMGCSNLKEVTLSPDISEIGGYAFNNCESLHSINFPEGLECIYYNSFEYCHSLTSVEFPSSLKKIWHSAFKECTNLSEVYFSKGLEEIGPIAFSYTKVTDVVLPDGLSIIDNYAFGHSSLRRLTIPESVTCFREKPLLCCFDLTDIYYTGSAAQWYSIENYWEIEGDLGNLGNPSLHFLGD